jgi:hypothetical protein
LNPNLLRQRISQFSQLRGNGKSFGGKLVQAKVARWPEANLLFAFFNFQFAIPGHQPVPLPYSLRWLLNRLYFAVRRKITNEKPPFAGNCFSLVRLRRGRRP